MTTNAGQVNRRPDTGNPLETEDLMPHDDATEPYLRPLAEFLDALEHRGVVLTPDGEQLAVRGWRRLTGPERDRLRTERAEVVALLTATAEPEPEAETAPPPVAKPADRPDPAAFTPGAGESHYVDRYLDGVEPESMTPEEAVVARRVFFDRINRGPRGRFADLLSQARNRL